jgi:hypothetical protein
MQRQGAVPLVKERKKQTSCLSRLMGCLFLFSFLLALVLMVGYRIYYFRLDWTYAQGTCTIEAGSTYHKNYGDGQNVDAVLPQFVYRVKTQEGRQFQASGYSSPLHYYTFNEEEAQAIVSGYEIGKSYPCWYNPFWPSQAVLVFDGLDQFTDVVMLGSLVNLFAGLIIGLGLLLLFSVYQDFVARLGKVQRRGKVVRYAEAIEGGQRYTSSIITFRTFWQREEFEFAAVLPLGNRVPLIYHVRKGSIQVGKLVPLFKLFCLLICGCGLIVLTILGFRLFNLTEMDHNFWGWSEPFFREITMWL